MSAEATRTARRAPSVEADRSTPELAAPDTFSRLTWASKTSSELEERMENGHAAEKHPLTAPPTSAAPASRKLSPVIIVRA